MPPKQVPGMQPNFQNPKDAPQLEEQRVVKSPSPLLGIILSILLPPIGLFISIWSLVSVTKNKQKGRALAIIGIVVGAILTAGLMMVFWVLYSIGGGGHSNQAQNAAKPIQNKIEQLGTQKLCSNGDNGYTLDNTEPWYSVYLSANDNKNLTSQVKYIASQSGYTLQVNTHTINDLKNGNNSPIPEVEVYSPSNDYLLGTNQTTEGSLSVEIIRSGQIALDCNSGTYGEPKSPQKNGAIILLSMSFPSTH